MDLESRLAKTEQRESTPEVPFYGESVVIEREGQQVEAYQFTVLKSDLEQGLKTLTGGKDRNGKERTGTATGITPRFLPFKTHSGKAHIAPSARWMSLKAY